MVKAALVTVVTLLWTCFAAASPSAEHAAKSFFRGKEGEGSSDKHTNNWAVLVCSSRYWFNYRHMANALGMYVNFLPSFARLWLPQLRRAKAILCAVYELTGSMR